jgi:hypothetical protein
MAKADEKEKPDNGSVTTGEVRLAFNDLFKKRKYDEDSREVFSCVLLFPPDYDLAPIKKMLRDAVFSAFGKDAKLSDRGYPLKECHGEYDGYDEGWHSMRCSNGYPIQVVDQNVQPLMDLDGSVIFSGCYIRANLSPYTWHNKKGGKGVSVNVNALQLLRKGESLTGRKPADELFEPIDTGGDEPMDDGDEAAEAAPARGGGKRGKPAASADDLFG